MWYAGRPIGLGVAPIIDVVWRYVVASLLAGLACYAIFSRIVFLSNAPGALGAVERTVFISIGFIGLYLGAIIILYRGLSPLKRLAGLLREMVPVARGKRAGHVTLAL
jgi:hypothetical protein